MDLRELNDNFNIIYKDIKRCAKYTIKKKKRNLDIETVLSECYIYVNLRKDEIKDLSELTAYCIQFIRRNIYWSNSQLNLKHKKDDNILYLDLNDEELYYIEDKNEYYFNIGDMIEQINNEFYNTLDQLDKRLFELFIIKEINTITKIGRHLNISTARAKSIRKQCTPIKENYILFIKNKINKC